MPATKATQKIQIQHDSTGFAKATLAAIGAPLTPNNIAYLKAQAAAENTAARYNPLATTENWKGATQFNSVGVKNYPDFNSGVAATAATLTNGHYTGIVGDLRAGTYTPQQIASRNVGELSAWGTGSAAVAANVGKTSERAFQLSGPVEQAGVGSALGDLWGWWAKGLPSRGGSGLPGNAQPKNIPGDIANALGLSADLKKVVYALAIGGGGLLILAGLLVLAVDLGLSERAKSNRVVVQVQQATQKRRLNKDERAYYENRRNTGGKPAKKGIPKKSIKFGETQRKDDDIPF